MVVDGNEVIGACISGYQEHLTIANTLRFEVKNNHVHHTAPGSFGKEGLSLKDGSSFGSVHHNHVHDILDTVGIYVDAEARYTHDIDVYSNRIHDIGGNCISLATEAGGLLENVRVFDNVGYSCKYLGLNVSACCPEVATHPIHGVTVVNNTFVRNGIGWGGGISVEAVAELQDLVIRNNLLSENLSFQIAVDSSVPQSEVTVDHNLVDAFQGGEGEIVGTGAIQLPAMLVDADAHDFRLQATSPAVDAGAPLAAPAFDFEGAARPVDGNADGVAAFDIGAYEYRVSNVHGDATGEGVVDARDIVFLINYLFAGGPVPPAAADANGDAAITIADVMWLVNFVFAGGAAPV